MEKEIKRTSPALLATLIIGGVVCLILFFVGMFFFVKTLFSFVHQNTISFGEDKIQTIYSLYGKRDVVGFNYRSSFDYSHFIVTYSDLSTTEIEKYIEFLEGDGYEVTKEFNGKIGILEKDSENTNKNIFVNIKYDDDYTYITYIKE